LIYTSIFRFRIFLCRILLLVPAFSCLPLQAQQLAEDTVFINVDQNQFSFPLAVSLGSISDTRDEAAGLVSYGSKRRYLLLPVDVLYCTSPPLPELIKNRFSGSSRPGPVFALDIRSFQIEKKKGIVFPSWVLNAEIRLLAKQADSTIRYGSFVYHIDYPILRGEKQGTACSRVLQSWFYQFGTDLLSIGKLPSAMEDPLIPAWVPGKEINTKHLNCIFAGTYGFGFWQLEGEMYFNYRESDRKTTYQAGIIRYQNTRNFESISFGSKSEHLQYRLNSRFCYDASIDALLGINKWKINSEVNPSLIQLMQLSLSSTQAFSLNPAKGSGFLIKAGIFGNLIYIPKRNPLFQVGLYSSFGFRY
jgi:hypothetical protein